MTDIWYTRMDNIPDRLVNRYREELIPEMQEEILRYKQEPDRKSRVLARKMINLYLKNNKGVGLQFSLGEHKKPFLPNGPYFNISHSGNYAVVAFSQMPVGVDIEEKRVIDWQQITTQFHEAEQEYITSHKNNEEAFYRVWVRKEAYLKAIGTGILSGLKTVNALEDMIEHEQKEWRLYDFELESGYATAICTPFPPNEHTLQIKNINPTLTLIEC